jgi:hypothetical protein
MAVDTTQLEMKIKRFQKLKELLEDADACDALADPEIMSQIKLSLGTNGYHSVDESSATAYLPEEGTLRLAVYEAAKRIHGRFDTKSIIAEMEKAGYKFAAKNPTASVYGALQKLKTEKLLRVVHTGSGRAPSIFAVKE